MMLQIMLYTMAVTAVLSVVGLCLERFASLQRLPRRTAWIAATLLSVLFPVAMILFARPAAMQYVPAPVMEGSVPYIIPDPAYPAESHSTPAPAQTMPAPAQSTSATSSAPRSTWKLPLPSDNQLIAAWVAASSVFALYLFAAGILLGRRTAGWQRTTMQGQNILISEVTGPALVGVLRPRIVVPRWLIEQPSATQALILAHEQQHMSARDPLLIMAGLFVIAAVPWNLPLWWQWRRMRQAIELDCDARVLRAGADAPSYADVLLAVAQRATRMPASVLTMSEPVHALERRIENLLPDAIRHAKLQTIAVLALAAAGAGVAVALEAPVLPAHAAAAASIPAAAAQVANPPAAPPTGSRSIPAGQSQPQPAPAPAPARFTVRILPVDASLNAAGRARWNRINQPLVERLRAVPGLRLLTNSTNRDSADYEVEIKLPADVGVQTFTIETSALKPRPASPSSPGGPSSRVYFNSAIQDGRYVWSFSFDNYEGKSAGDLPFRIDSFVTGMQKDYFPPDPNLQQELLTRLANPRLDHRARAVALGYLLSGFFERRRPPGLSRGSSGLPPPSPEFIRAAVEFANSQSDPDGRAGTWGRLREIDSPDLIAPLIQALDTEKDANVRLVLLIILVHNHSEDPQARATLESIAGTDPRQLMRMAAQHALTGNAGWNEYLLATLKNPQLTDEQRLEPLTYPYLSGLYRQEQPPLDEDAIRALGSLLARAKTDTIGTSSAVSVLDNVGGPAADEAISSILWPREGSQVAYEIRATILWRQANKIRYNTVIRGLVEEVAARDTDARMREQARAMLEQVAQR